MAKMVARTLQMKFTAPSLEPQQLTVDDAGRPTVL